MSCQFIDLFQKLSKMSTEAVDNADSFDDLKKYLHVKRTTEDDLKSLIKSISIYDHKKLVIVCGSAGDGKSHLLSYLKNCDDENLLSGYTIINDATESDAPQKTAIESLARKITAFSDDQLANDSHENVILAINLGMLNNFLESEIGKDFSMLKEYVHKNNIFNVSDETPTVSDQFFYHIDFSDYQLYSLSEQGAKSLYISELFNRIFSQNEDNPFYTEYCHNSSCINQAHCPVRHNYQMLMQENVQSSIVNLIIEVCIKEKIVVTSRDILNFIFDIVVSPKFDETTLWNLISTPSKFLHEYISHTTPMLIFDNIGTSDLIDNLSNNARLNTRSEGIDEDILNFYADEDISARVKEALNGTPYLSAVENVDLSVFNDEATKKYLFKFSAYCSELESPLSISSNVYDSFVKDLYNSIAGNKQRLRDLYADVQNCILSWNGKYGDYICIDLDNDDYCILEKLKFNAAPNTPKARDEVERFSPVINVCFKDETGNRKIDIQIDYRLYLVIKEMRGGYQPMSQDQNLHADFVSKIKAISEFGSQKNSIVIIPKNDNNGERYAFECNEFGYVFKVVTI